MEQGANKAPNSSDIGRETVKLLALKGAKVYFTTRSEAKANEARKRIQDDHPEIDSDKLQSMIMDATDLRSISSVADKLKERERKVDILGESVNVAPWLHLLA